MIAKTLKHIADELNGYLDDHVTAANQIYRAEITNIQNTDNNADPGIKIALINVEEDKVYKNHLLPIEGRNQNAIDPIHPLGGILAMRVNVYILIAFNAQNSQTLGYLNTLSIMTHVMRFFHSKPYHRVLVETSPDRHIGVEIEYHNINLEDSNNMWSNLGGEQKPYAMYKIKMLEILPDAPDQLDAVIKHTPVISDPLLDGDGNTLYNGDGTPQGDNKKIQHLNKNN